MKNIYISLVIISIFIPASAQVGINTSTPTATLEVIGNVKTDSSLFLENPGDNSQIRGSIFLIRSTTNNLLKYDISQSKYGPINYVEFVFRDLSTDGLLDYDTKISINDYFISVQGYSFGEAGSNKLGSIMPHSTISNDNIEGYQFYAYPDETTETWFLRAYVNNSQFQIRSGNTYENTPIDMFLNIMIYRKGFITKSQSDISVDMGDLESGTAPIPSGF